MWKGDGRGVKKKARGVESELMYIIEGLPNGIEKNIEANEEKTKVEETKEIK